MKMKKLWLIIVVMFVLCGCSAEKYEIEESSDVTAVEVFEEEDGFVSKEETFEGDEEVEAPKESVNAVATVEEAAVIEKTEVEAEPDEEKVSYDVIGNRKSKKYHLPSCYTLPYPENQVHFESAEAAANKGYKPCKNCRP